MNEQVAEPAPPDDEFDALLQFLYETHGSNFTGYKRAPLMRRVQKRLDQLRLSAYDDYIDYLQVRPEEYAALFDTILINVTAFFRDPLAWDRIRNDVLPQIVANCPKHEPIRVWSAGCASGEEAYSIAVLLAEQLGPEEFRQRVKIYATDIDEEALNRGRQGVYWLKELAAVPDDLRSKYFEIRGQRGVFPQNLRRSVIFGRHDLLLDAPISRIDVLLCRNTLMYFTAEAQARVLARLHYALNDEGFLFVGRAEMLLTHANLFVPLDAKQRIFTKVNSPSFRSRLSLFSQGNDDLIGNHVGRQVQLREAAFDADANAMIIVDADGVLVMANELARQTLGVSLRDIGGRLQDVEVSYRPVELRAVIEQALVDRRVLQVAGVERPLQNGGTQFLDVTVTPLAGPDAELLGASVTFEDVSASSRLQSELTRSRQELETAYEELQSTNEELETTNEELQSTVEELETTNEELQSANEELETMNEELQSTNGELHAINSELQQRGAEVDRLNSFVESVLGSLDAGVIALDSELRIVVWNSRSADLWGLRDDEVIGQPLLTQDIGLPVRELAPEISACLAGDIRESELVVSALTRRGRTIRARVTCTLVRGPRGIDGVVLLTEDITGSDGHEPAPTSESQSAPTS